MLKNFWLSTYEPATGLLTIKDVEFAGQHYYVELRDPEGYDAFVVTYVQPLTAAIHSKPATFDGQKVVIPSVFAFGREYSVDLGIKEGVFAVTRIGDK